MNFLIFNMDSALTALCLSTSQPNSSGRVCALPVKQLFPRFVKHSVITGFFLRKWIIVRVLASEGGNLKDQSRCPKFANSPYYSQGIAPHIIFKRNLGEELL